MFGLLQVIKLQKQKRIFLSVQRSIFCDFCQKLAIFAALNLFFLPFFLLPGACNLLSTNKEKNFCSKRILYRKKCIFAS